METQHGGLSIHAAGAGHDDLAMALCQAAHAIQPDALWGNGLTFDVGQVADVETVTTPSGLIIPKHPRPIRAGGIRRRDLLHVY